MLVPVPGQLSAPPNPQGTSGVRRGRLSRAGAHDPGWAWGGRTGVGRCLGGSGAGIRARGGARRRGQDLAPGGAVPRRGRAEPSRARPHLPGPSGMEAAGAATGAATGTGGGARPRGRRAAGGWAPCLALALGWALGWALGAEPPHRCRPDAALLPPPLRRLAGAALLRAAVPRLRGGWSPCQLYRYRHGPPATPGTGPGTATARPDGTGPCTRGWHYALPAAGLRSNMVTQVGGGIFGEGGDVWGCRRGVLGMGRGMGRGVVMGFLSLG